MPCGFQVLDTRVLIPSRALALRIATRTSQVWLINVYLHENHKSRDLSLLVDILPTLGSASDFVIVGDFNRADATHTDLWNQLLAASGTVDVDPLLPTFFFDDRASCLDRVLVPSNGICHEHFQVSIRTQKHFHVQGHATLLIDFKSKPKVSSNPADPLHEVFPTSAFRRDLVNGDYRVPELGVAELHRALSGEPAPTFFRLQDVIWAWWRSQTVPGYP